MLKHFVADVDVDAMNDDDVAELMLVQMETDNVDVELMSIVDEVDDDYDYDYDYDDYEDDDDDDDR